MSSKLRKRLQTDSFGFSDCHTGTNQPAADLPHPWFWEASSCWLIKTWEDNNSPPPTHNALLPFLIGLIILPPLGVTLSFWTPPHIHAHPLGIITSTPHPTPHPPSIQLPLMAALLLFRWLCATHYLACSMTHVCCFDVAKQECLMDGSSRHKRLRHVAELMWYK